MHEERSESLKAQTDLHFQAWTGYNVGWTKFSHGCSPCDWND